MTAAANHLPDRTGAVHAIVKRAPPRRWVRSFSRSRAAGKTEEGVPLQIQIQTPVTSR